MKEEQKAALIDNTARNMNGVTENVKYRHAVHCYKADTDYGMRLADAMSLDKNKVKEMAGLTEKELQEATRSY